MLVLSRRKDESIVIRVPPSDKVTEIVVALVEIRGDKSSLGIQAPDEVKVNRAEVQEKVDAEGRGL